MTTGTVVPFTQSQQDEPLSGVITSSAPAQHEEIPAFEGNDVSATAAKVTSVSTLEIGDVVLRMDEMVEMRITARVVSVEHKAPNGGSTLTRVHTIKAIEAELVRSWDAGGREKTY